MASIEFLPGSVLRAYRGLYFHYGVYVGGGKVVHFSSKGKGEMNAATADIILTSFKAFSKGDVVSLDTRGGDFPTGGDCPESDFRHW